jgi:hypothetical protein
MLRWAGVLIGLVLTACGGSQIGSTSDPQRQMVGSLTRSGGLAGRSETLTIYADNTVRVTQGEGQGAVVAEASVPAAQVQSLQAVFASNDWQSLDAEYGQQVPDGYAYTISGGGKQVRTYDGATLPPVLASILEQMNALWPPARPRSS